MLSSADVLEGLVQSFLFLMTTEVWCPSYKSMTPKKSKKVTSLSTIYLCQFTFTVSYV
jgi:hypothetical protein